MGRLKLRQVAAAFVLLSAGMGLALNFADGLASATDQQFTEKDSINQLRSDFGEKSANVQGTQDETSKTEVQSNQFFLTSVFNIMSSVVNSATNLITFAPIIESATGIVLPQAVIDLIGLVTVGVIFAFVAAARGWDV